MTKLALTDGTMAGTLMAMEIAQVSMMDKLKLNMKHAKDQILLMDHSTLKNSHGKMDGTSSTMLTLMLNGNHMSAP